MSDRYEGGILSGTAPTVTLQGANGVYTLSQEMQYQGQGVWPTAAQTPILKSLRFRSSASATLSRTPGSASNRKTWTFSAWVKRGKLTSNNTILNAGYPTVSWFAFIFGSDDTLQIAQTAGSSAGWKTAALFRDPSAWYHVICVVDTTSSTSTMNGSSTDRMRLYVNGVQYVMTSGTIPSQNSDLQVNNTISHTIGGYSSEYYDGEIAEVNFIDGIALTPSSFGTTDANGIWQPIPYTGTYGTNGYYLPFTNNTSTSTLGNDSSGNSNTWTVNNISLTSGTTYDSMLDSPSNASSTIANYAVLNPLNTVYTGKTITNGNLQTSGTTVNQVGAHSTIGVSSGKWYVEGIMTANAGGQPRFGVNGGTQQLGASGASYLNDGGKELNGNYNATYGSSWTTNDVIGIALDMDTGEITFYKNGTSQGVAYTGITSSVSSTLFFSCQNNASGTTTFVLNFGQQPFVYTPPTGFNRLNTYNLPVPTIPAGNKVMDATLFTGTGATQSITNAGGFKPDLVWSKTRNTSQSHSLIDSVRGITKVIYSDYNGGEDTFANMITSINSNGVTYGSGNGVVNSSPYTYVAWQWQAGQGVTSSNTNGSITSTVSVNQTAGFSIVTYTGNGSTGTVGHGLGVAPSMYIVKRLSGSPYDWYTYHVSLGNTNFIRLNTTGASTTYNLWQDTTPTSSLFYLANDTGVNASSTNFVAYCWSEIAGFSKFGSFTGNASSDGPFVYLGFRPRFILMKNASSSVQGWTIQDTSRSTYNVVDNYLLAQASSAEQSTYAQMDYLSNGFKLKTNDALVNGSGNTIIYMAFAENPFKMARAR